MNTVEFPFEPGLKYGERPQRYREPYRNEVFTRWISAASDRVTVPDTIDRFEKPLADIRQLSERLDAGRPGAALSTQMPDQSDLRSCFAGLLRAVREIYSVDLHDEQLFGAWMLVHGRLVEMQTGEGKTLTAGLAAVAVAMTGTPVHVLTTNEYLAARDSEILAPLYARFGLQGPAVLESQSDNERRDAYGKPICHLAHRQVIFDWLRDRESHGENAVSLRSRLSPLYDAEGEPPLMRGLCFAIVDEADSVLIDEALMPFVLASGRQASRDKFAESVAALSMARTLRRDHDFEIDEGTGRTTLSDDGEQAIAEAATRIGGVWRHRSYRITRIAQALSALHHFRRDQHYLVRDGKVLLIDQMTGRVAADRRLQHGLQGMIEVKERCETSAESVPTAAITAQELYPRYRAMCGLSGTLRGLQGELRRTYGLCQVSVPPHRPLRRVTLAPSVYRKASAQLDQLVAVVSDRQRRGQAVLIGTRTVKFSEQVSTLLMKQGIDHDLLNARQDAGEAAIISRAGEAGAVTVATNMAGRGTDIPLSPLVKERGGLLVIAVEVNTSKRLDRQLFGRAGRQGDPGVAWHLLSLEDEVLQARLPATLMGLLLRFIGDDEQLPSRIARSLLTRAQNRASREDARRRRQMYNSRDDLAKKLAVAGEAGSG